MDNNIIEKLLASGETPESIYQSALKITQEQEKKKKEQLQKEIDRRRDAALKALFEYLELIGGEPLTEEEKKGFEEDFKRKIEQGVRSEKLETRERKKDMRGNPLDPAFEKFLRDMGFLDD